jgi:hypothetical protein
MRIVRALFTRLAVAGGLLAIYHRLIRPRITRWGATAEEAARVLPGDEISPRTTLRSTMAITIAAPPEAIWPWLVQMGWNRGGFYSHNRIEKLFGLDLHNAAAINPAWQNLAVGDTVRMSHPRLDMVFPETRVATLDHNRALVLAIMPPQNVGGGVPSGAWSFVLDPIDETSTRVLVRLQVSPPILIGRMFIYLFNEPAHYFMQRGGLLGLRERVERRALEEATGDTRPRAAAA